MPSTNSRIRICAAGGGKTTSIVKEAIAAPSSRLALVTYTQNNKREIESKFYECGPAIPPNVEIMTWFSFLLREMARPYRPVLHDQRIDGFCWVEGRSVPMIPERNTAIHYFANKRFVYSDKIAKFICECNRLSGGAILERLAQRFDHIVIDEVQDLAGYDLEILELILSAGIKVTLVGDHRQATFKTNNASKNSSYSGIKIINKLREWDKRGSAVLNYEQHTYRCHQHIADLGDSLFPKEPSTKSLNTEVTGHDGIFVVSSADAESYIQKFTPQILRLDKKTPCNSPSAMNFGEAKGLTFNRVLIYPHGLAQKWLATGDLKHVEKSAAKLYVGVTRARYSLAFVFDKPTNLPRIQLYRA